MGTQDFSDTSPETTSAQYVFTIHNTTDNSERMRIIHTAFTDAGSQGHGSSLWGHDSAIGASQTKNESVLTWINVTTAHDINSLIALEGTSVLNYDISGPAGDLASTAIEVYLSDGGNNGTHSSVPTTAANSLLSLVTSGNSAAGVQDLDDDTKSNITTTFWEKTLPESIRNAQMEIEASIELFSESLGQSFEKTYTT